METIQSAFNTALINISVAVISLLAAYALYYLGLAKTKVTAQIAQLKDEKARKTFTEALENINELVGVTVSAIEQTTAAALRKAVKAGSANRADLLALGKQAFDDIKAKVAPEAQQVITENLGSFDDYLQNLIETKVLELKSSTAPLAVDQASTESTPAVQDAEDQAPAEQTPTASS